MKNVVISIVHLPGYTLSSFLVFILEKKTGFCQVALFSLFLPVDRFKDNDSPQLHDF